MTGTPRGLFIAFEGGDGAGKSTQARHLAGHLEALGDTVIMTREPGGTPIGDKLRALVLDHGNGTIDARTEALMFAASRAAHVDQVIRPAQARGDIIITDRYIDSSVAYQGSGRELGVTPLRDLNAWATLGLRPDLTILLDVPESTGRMRRTGRVFAEDRIEAESDAFHAKIRTAFLHEAARTPTAYLVLDARRPRAEVARAISARVTALREARRAEAA
jgi:dTMP kinase